MTDSRERFGVRRALVVIQVALSLVLVVGALLFVRTLRNLTAARPRLPAGWRAASPISITARPVIAPDAIAALDRRRCSSACARSPVSTRAAQVFTTPVGGNFWNEHVIVGGAEQAGNVNFNRVGPGYFQALATPLVAGRDFADRDTPQSPEVAIVSESFAKKYFTGRHARSASRSRSRRAVGEPRPLTHDRRRRPRHESTRDLREAFTPIAYLAIGAERTRPTRARRSRCTRRRRCRRVTAGGDARARGDQSRRSPCSTRPCASRSRTRCCASG